MPDYAYEIGDTIQYSPFGGGVRTVLVTNKEEDIKNDEPGFVGDVLNYTGPEAGERAWGYDYQIIAVVNRAGTE